MAGVASLRSRAEGALKALAEGRRRLAHGQEAVQQLLQELQQLRQTTDLDLREVQESVLEHTAMFAKNPEVLGSMIHLVFTLDLMNQWLSSRDQELDHRLEDLKQLQQELGKHQRALEQLNSEVLDLRTSSAGAGTAGSRELQELRRENQRLRRQLQQPAAVPEPVAAQLQGPWATVGAGMVECLQQLEPLLATMPNTPGFLDLQEEACEAYHELRRILLEAVALSTKVPDVPAF
eukprot:Skav229046  [mRNA]  locus=scaffold2828:53321:54025:+ [translate_table: standard]